MYRIIEEDLKSRSKTNWKTYILEKFGKNNFKQYIYINLDKEEYVREIFDNTIEPDTIIEKIEILKNKIIPFICCILYK